MTLRELFKNTGEFFVTLKDTILDLQIGDIVAFVFGLILLIAAYMGFVFLINIFNTFTNDYYFLKWFKKYEKFVFKTLLAIILIFGLTAVVFRFLS
tara:strand:- start:529 stop:816 length:288 start_codon:yes stop_codon:yes gene_type:complete